MQGTHRTRHLTLPSALQVAYIDGTADMSAMAERLYASPRFWLAGVLLAPAMSLLLDLALDMYQRTFRPKPYQILQVRHDGAVAGGVRSEERLCVGSLIVGRWVSLGFGEEQAHCMCI